MAGKGQRVARIVSRIVHSLDMRKADKADDEQAEYGRHAKRNDFRCGHAGCTGSRVRNHGRRLSALHPRAFTVPIVSGRSPGSRIERL